MADHMNELRGMLRTAESIGERDTADALRAAIAALRAQPSEPQGDCACIHYGLGRAPYICSRHRKGTAPAGNAGGDTPQPDEPVAVDVFQRSSGCVFCDLEVDHDPATCKVEIATVADDLERLGKEDGWICASVGAALLRKLAPVAQSREVEALRRAVEHAHDWFEAQAKLISKGCGSTWDLVQCQEQRDMMADVLAPSQEKAS